ncbi:MAG: diacylglycerol/lipid kinase family protein, partial [Chloroflexota bacterium]
DEWLALPEHERPLIVAAGGDGTVGTVADRTAHAGAILGILPLGTSNDVARSLAIPMRIEAAAALLRHGRVATVDAGYVRFADGSSRYFVHAAATGLNVTFSRMAGRASLRRRLGRLNYLFSAVVAWRSRHSFACELLVPDREVPLRLLHLSVINAPIFGGFLRLRLSGSEIDNRRLAVLAIEAGSSFRLLLAGLALLLRRTPRVGGIHLYHVPRLSVRSAEPLPLSLDGEVRGNLPGSFEIAVGALRMVTP